MRARPEPISPSAAAQSRAGSILETFAHTLARFFVSVFATAHVLPLVGVWGLAAELRFGFRAEALARRL